MPKHRNTTKTQQPDSPQLNQQDVEAAEALSQFSKFMTEKVSKEGSDGEGPSNRPHRRSEEKSQRNENETTEVPHKEFRCGVSSAFGDTIGVLKAYDSGIMKIFCSCSSCLGTSNGVFENPPEFAQHGGCDSAGKWDKQIWIFENNREVPFYQVEALRVYNPEDNPIRKRKTERSHRDEFIDCTKCKKSRRFTMNSKRERRLYHDARLNPTWECSNTSSISRLASCEELAERRARQQIRGCPRERNCDWCQECVCLGCRMCKYLDCECSDCVAFYRNLS